MNERGVEIGEPLENFQGVLTGVPTYVGTQETLKKASDGE